MLKLGIVGFTERPAKRKIADQTSRWRNLSNVNGDRSNREGRDAFGFEYVGERTDSTRAQRSDRGEDHQIDFIVFEQGGGSRTTVQAQARHGFVLITGE